MAALAHEILHQPINIGAKWPTILFRSCLTQNPKTKPF
jgi:hypothetical protein